MILWLEDQRDTVRLYEQAIKERGLKYLVVGTIDEVVEYLEDAPDERPTFVVDIMLYGIEDLSSIGIKNAPTLSGNRAGQVFVERFLRAPKSKFKLCPVIFLTECLVDDPLRDEVAAVGKKGFGEARIYEKYSQDQLREFLAALESFTAKAPKRDTGGA